MCSCPRSACTLPFLVGLCGVGVCAWAQVSAAPRHSWLGCWGVCVFVGAPRLYPATSGWGVGVCVCVFVCTPRLYPATAGWGVRCGCLCLGLDFGCAPPLLAGVLGCVCVCWRAPLVPGHSWLGCAVWVCVPGLRFRLRPATPGWAVGVCLCLWPRSAYTLPLVAGVCGVGVCAWALVSAAPRTSWLGCRGGVCVFVGAPLFYPTTPGWGVRCWCVCFGLGFSCAPPLLAGMCRQGVCALARVPAAPRHSWLGCWAVCVFLGAPCLYPATPGWGVRRGCVCLGWGFACAPPLLAGRWGVSVFVCALRL